MRAFSKDLIHAARSLRKHPAFTLAALLTLALGIGASAAIFGVVNAVLLRPLPYEEPERLTLLWGDMRARDVTDFPFPPGDFHDMREQLTAFSGLAAVVTGRQPLAGDAGAPPEQVRFAAVTPNFFSLLGVEVAHGRDFTEADATPNPPPPQQAQGGGGAGAAPAAPQPPPLPAITILSHEFWQRRFGGERDVLGRMVDVGGGRAEIVGVLPPNFEILFPPGTSVERTPDMFTALRVDYEAGSRINVFLRVIGRLAPGASLQQARTQAEALAADLRQRFPIKQTSDLHFRVEPMHGDLVAEVRPAIVALMGAVVFVLLIACANVANLLLVRAGGRGRELAVRAALGGTRWRLARQVLAESVLLAGLGVALGTGLAFLAIRLLRAVAPANLPRLDAVGIDGTVLLFAGLAGAVAAVTFGMMPAIRASQPDIMDVLRAGGRSSALGGGRLLRNAVVTAEVALSFVLLIGCGLMVRSFIALQRTDPGFDPSGVLTFELQSVQPLPAPEARAAFQRTTMEQLRALPGVQAVTAVNPIPLDGSVLNVRWGPPEAASDAARFQQANLHIVLPGYHEAMRTRLIAGRTFTEADNDPDARVVVLDELLAATAFPGQPARSTIGKQLLIRSRGNEPELMEVIGVVAHQRHVSLTEAAGRDVDAIFFADGFFGHGAAGNWVLRSAGDPNRLAPQVRAFVRQSNPPLALAELRPLQEYVDRAQASTRFSLVLITIFAGIAAVLAAVGLYGVLATAVRQRTAEIGVRMAFGATQGNILRLIIGHGLRLSVAGIAIGAVVAVALTRLMSSMLVGIEATDPPTYAAVALLFAAIAGVASWLPARRASALDPTVALREE